MVYSDFYDTPKSFWMILCLEMDVRYDTEVYIARPLRSIHLIKKIYQYYVLKS